MTNREKLLEVFPYIESVGTVLIHKDTEQLLGSVNFNWLSAEYKEPTTKIDYRRAFKIACDLLNGNVLYGVDTDDIYELMMKKDGVVSSSSYEEYILNHLQELDQGQYASEPTTKNDLGVDCIDRNAIKYFKGYGGAMYASKGEIDKLPSVTPQLSSELEKNSKKLEKNFGELDCISRVEVIDYLCKHCPDDGECFKDCDEIKHLRQMPSVTPQEPRWIPVSEYLPVTNDEVLVTYIVNGNAKKRYVETANCFDGEWSSVNDEYRIPNTKIEIIAWCEMPKPYKAESEGK